MANLKIKKKSIYTITMDYNKYMDLLDNLNDIYDIVLCYNGDVQDLSNYLADFIDELANKR